MIKNAEEARSIIKTLHKGYLCKSQLLKARLAGAYLEALAGPDVNGLVEALKEIEESLNSPSRKYVEIGMLHRIAREALFRYRKAIGEK